MQPVDFFNHTAPKQTRTILGLMSGTSLDGLDIALCRIQGQGVHSKAEVVHFESRPYAKKLRHELQSYAYRASTPQYQACVLNAQLGRVFARYVNDFLRKNHIETTEVDLIASHGQTIYHAPTQLKTKPHSTLQIADGDHIAQLTGIPVLSDFRQKHVAIGGEGAPLSSYADHLLYHQKGIKRILLNIGGISNFTLLDGSGDPKSILTGDLGPGNTLIDRFVRLNYKDYEFDQDGVISSRGMIDEKSLYRLMEDEFFDKDFPKSTGQEYFNERYVLERISTQLDGDDLITTLAAFTVSAIKKGLSKLQLGKTEVFVSGGGRYNPTLMHQLRQHLKPMVFKDIEALGVRADAKESLLFAILANESLWGEGIYVHEFDKRLRLGKLSMP